MRNSKDESLWQAVLEEHAEAFDEWCTEVETVAEQLGRGESPSLEDLAREQSARLRLENARALLTFGVGIRPTASG